MPQEAFKDRIIPSPEPDITREEAMQAFMALRAQAQNNGAADLSLEEINKEIDLTRSESRNPKLS